MPVHARQSVNMTEERKRRFDILLKEAQKRDPDMSASGLICQWIDDRWAKRSDPKRQQLGRMEDKIDGIGDIMRQVRELTVLLAENHGVNLAVTVQQPNGANWAGCDNAPE